MIPSAQTQGLSADISYSSALTQDFMKRIRKGMTLLLPFHREILILKTADGLSYEEIAATLAISVGTVKRCIANAREALRALSLLDQGVD